MLPVFFHLPGGRPVFAYGVMMGLAFLLGLIWTSRRARARTDLEDDVAGNAYLIAGAVGFLGARALYVWMNPVLLEEADIAFWEIQKGGLIGFGGLLAAALAAAAYLRLKKTSFLAFAEAVLPALILFQIFCRIGSYLYGSDFGTRLGPDAPEFLQMLGTFPRWEEGGHLGPPVLVYHMERYYLALDATLSYPVHPVQLYGVGLGLLLAVLYGLWTRDAQALRGQRFLKVALVFVGGRFLLDYLRADPDRGLLFGFSVTQLGCMLLAPLLWFGLQQLRRQRSVATSV